MKKRKITRKRLKELLDYNEDSGEFRWKARSSNVVKIGELAGTSHRGYIKIGLDGETYKAHHLAYLYMTGKYPQSQIDHINHDKSDNSWRNLRTATQGENMKNQPLKATNKSGCHGVYFDSPTRKWRAQIINNKRKIHIGLYADLEDAIAARKNAEVKYGYHKNHGSTRSTGYNSDNNRRVANF